MKYDVLNDERVQMLKLVKFTENHSQFKYSTLGENFLS